VNEGSLANAKLSPSAVQRIRRLSERLSYTQLARRMGIHRTTVSRAARALTWTDVLPRKDDQLASRNLRPVAKLSPETVAEIRRLSNAVNHRELAAIFGINRATVWRIVNRRTWRDLA
jgi:DNA-binding transcriptional regulator YiaG